jgi:hypothetical protein
MSDSSTNSQSTRTSISPRRSSSQWGPNVSISWNVTRQSGWPPERLARAAGAVGPRWWGGEADRERCLAAPDLGAGVLEREDHLLVGGLQPVAKRPAKRGEGDHAAGTVEQPAADACLEPGDEPADPCRGQMQAGRGTAEIQFGREERPQLVGADGHPRGQVDARESRSLRLTQRSLRHSPLIRQTTFATLDRARKGARH